MRTLNVFPSAFLNGRPDGIAVHSKRSLRTLRRNGRSCSQSGTESARNRQLVLIWVQKKDEPELRNSFQRTLAVRKLSPEAKELADRYLFETVVRLHRAGEGAPYTGLKPAGRDLGPAIPAADKALEEGSLEPVMKLLTSTVDHGVREQFNQALARKNFKTDDIAAGQEYVNSYVRFIHYVERLYEAAKHPAEHHYEETGVEEAH